MTSVAGAGTAPRRVRILRSGSIVIDEVESKHDDFSDASISAYGHKDRMIPTERRAFRKEGVDTNVFDSLTVRDFVSEKGRASQGESNPRASFGSKGGINAMYWDSFKDPITSPEFALPASRKNRADSQFTQSTINSQGPYLGSSKPPYVSSSNPFHSSTKDVRAIRTDAMEFGRRSSSAEDCSLAIGFRHSQGSWRGRDRYESKDSLEDFPSRSSVYSRKLSTSDLASRVGTVASVREQNREQETYASPIPNNVPVPSMPSLHNTEGDGEDRVVDLEASRNFLKSANDEDLERRLSELRGELAEMKRIQTETEAVFGDFRSRTSSLDSHSVAEPPRAASYRPVWRRTSVDSALSTDTLPVAARTAPLPGHHHDQVSPSSLIELRLSQLQTEEKLVLDQLSRLNAEEQKRETRVAVQKSVASWPIAVQGDAERSTRINQHARPLVEQYAALIRQLQRGSVMHMVMERNPNGRHRVVEVEVKVTDMLARLEWSPVHLKPRKRYAVKLENVVAIMCGSASEAARMGSPEDCLFRLHLAAVKGSAQPPPLQFASASPEQRHNWVLGLSLFHSMRSLSKQHSTN